MKEKNKFLRGALCGALAMFFVLAVIYTGVTVISGQRSSSDDPVNAATERKIKKIESIIKKSYLYEDKVDAEELAEGVLKGYVEALDDPYSVYYDKKATAEFQEATEGKYSGVGAVLTQNMETNLITIVNVYKESPAEEAGLKDGDILFKVDGKDLSGLSLTEVVSHIKGPEGTKVKITVLRGEDAKEVTVTATRRSIEAETVEYEMKADKIGYLRVSEFDAVTLDQYKAALKNLESKGMKGLVVDLRGNPGGNLDTVCKMLDLMLPKGLVVYTEDKDGNRQTATSDDEHQFTKPMAVLVDGNSASASEIYAGAIQDYGLGKIVGTTTYGKGVVQQIFDLKDGTCMKLTISQYFTPKGRSINGKGIKPDVEVKYVSNDKDKDADNQLDEALKIVKDEVK